MTIETIIKKRGSDILEIIPYEPVWFGPLIFKIRRKVRLKRGSTIETEDYYHIKQ